MVGSGMSDPLPRVAYTRARLGLDPRPVGWKPKTTIAQIIEHQIAGRMAASARETQAAMRDAEMLDGCQDRRWPKGRAA